MTEQSKCGSCQDKDCGARVTRPGETPEQLEERRLIAETLCQIKHKILVLSGKGGVGKSTVATNLALALSSADYSVGLLDVDIHGPSIPRTLGLSGQRVQSEGDRLLPVHYSNNLSVLSVGFLLKKENDAVIWRGPMKYSLIKQFIKDVSWGQLDFLIVDSPPGTGDEPLAITQILGSGNVDGALIVTTPQEISLSDVRRSIEFCRVINLPVLGVIENMSGFVCPDCGTQTDIFKRGGGETMAGEMMVPFMGTIPIDPGIVGAADDGKPYIIQNSNSVTAKAYDSLMRKVLRLHQEEDKH